MLYVDLSLKGDYIDRKELAQQAEHICRKKHGGVWTVSDTRKGKGVYKGRICFRLRQENQK